MSGRVDPAIVRARILVVALAAGPLALLAAGHVAAPDPAMPGLAFPAALAGLVAPAIAWRLDASLRERSAGVESFVRATCLALAVTEGAALLGVVAFLVSRDPLALIGVAMHLLLAGALWPSARRLDAFRGPPR